MILQTESPRNITVVTAHTYKISCSSNIGVTPVWRRNGSLVTSSQPISGTPGVYVRGPANQERVLVLQNITQSVVGTYVCLEGNSQDADSATFIVTTGKGVQRLAVFQGCYSLDHVITISTRRDSLFCFDKQLNLNHACPCGKE